MGSVLFYILPVKQPQVKMDVDVVLDSYDENGSRCMGDSRGQEFDIGVFFSGLIHRHPWVIFREIHFEWYGGLQWLN